MNNSVLSLLVNFIVFIIPLFPIAVHQILYNIIFKFIGISGQMYIAIIIAALMSKLLGHKNKDN